MAAIDCGTNSTRLLVVDSNGHPLERQMRITRLGEDVDATGMLAPDAIARTVGVLGEYRRIMDHLSVVRGRLVATSAARDATNGEDFLAGAGEATGLEPELLSGIEEGRLSLTGAVSDLDARDGPFLVLDVGGGSTELISGAGPDDPGLAAVSMQLGCVRLTERCLPSDPPRAVELQAAEKLVGEALDQAIADHPKFLASHRMIGLAGTITTLAALHLGLASYDRDHIHHAVLSAGSVFDWYRTLAGEVRSARLDRAGMVSGREDVIVAGAMIVAAVMARFGFDECTVSEADILDGMVAGLLVRI